MPLQFTARWLLNLKLILQKIVKTWSWFIIKLFPILHATAQVIYNACLCCVLDFFALQSTHEILLFISFLKQRSLKWRLALKPPGCSLNIRLVVTLYLFLNQQNKMTRMCRRRIWFACTKNKWIYVIKITFYHTNKFYGEFKCLKNVNHTLKVIWEKLSIYLNSNKKKEEIWTAYYINNKMVIVLV